MVKLVKIIKESSDMKDIIDSCKYTDDVIGNIADYNDYKKRYVYSNILEKIISVLQENKPSYYNNSYPHCVNATIGPYGFSYIKDGLGMGIATSINRKTEEVTYTLTFYFNKDKSFLKHNDCFNWCLENDFNLIEIENKKKKK